MNDQFNGYSFDSAADWNPDLGSHGLRDGYPDHENYDSPAALLDPTANANSSGTLHLYSDLDSHTLAQHHTLGTGRNQSSPGNHTHDGTTSVNIGKWIDLPNFTWASTSSPQPAVGTGTVAARYCKIGTLVFVRMIFKANAGMTFGTGQWTFSSSSLPPAKVNYGGTIDGNIGSAMVISGAGQTTVALGVIALDVWTGITTWQIASAGVAQMWGPSIPLAWAATANTNDFVAQFFYESAS